MGIILNAMNMQEKVIIVTGGAQGIGKCVAEHLASEGAQIAIVDVNIDLATQVATFISNTYNTKAYAFCCDVTNPNDVVKTVSAIATKFGKIDSLFNNAGICMHKSVLDISADEWLKIINVNLNGAFYMAREVGKYFIDNSIKGNIVSTASMSGSIVNVPQEQTSYNTSKAAVVHMTKSLAVEWAKYGVRVNCISPGYIYTDMTASVDKKMLDFWTDMVPYKRMGKPEELSGAVLYLMSDAASYTSGCDIIIDGCFTCI